MTTNTELMTREHELKTDPEVFDVVASGAKKFEIRFDDRGFRVGDILALRKTRHTGQQMRDGAPLEYVGAPLYAYVTHILRGPIYGLADGWVCMSIQPRDTAASVSAQGQMSDFEHAAQLLESYAAYLRSEDFPVKDLERHPYIPEIEEAADFLRSQQPDSAAQVPMADDEWGALFTEVRDNILNGRGHLDGVLDNNQTNAVLDELDRLDVPRAVAAEVPEGRKP